MATLKFILDENEKIYNLTNKVTKVGRNDKNDIIISLSGVSGNHFQIIKENDEYFIEDLLSTRGTFLNNIPINERTLLKHRDIIKAGSLEIIFNLENGKFKGDVANFLDLLIQINKVPVEDILTKTLEMICEALSPEQAFIIVREEDTGLFIPKYVFPENISEYKISFTVVHEAFKKKKYVYYEDIKTEKGASVTESILRYDLTSLLCIPLIYLDKCKGLFYFVFDRSSKNFNSKLKFLNHIASLSSLLLDVSENNENKKIEDEKVVKLDKLDESDTILINSQIELSVNKSKAFIKIHKDIPNFPDKDKIINILHKNNVKTGFIENNIDKFVKRKICDDFICVAKEKILAPDNIISPVIYNNEIKKAFRSSETKSIEIGYVKKNQNIVKIDFNDISDHILVDGTTIKKYLYNSDEIDFMCAYNCILKKSFIVSKIEGNLFVRNKKFYVIPVMKINSIEKMAFSNIDFNGSVEVSGITFKGMKIIAKEKIILKESSNASIIISKNNSVIINGTHYGSKNSKILASKNVKINSIRETFIFSKKNIYVDNIIFDSNIVCNGKLIVGRETEKGLRGSIHGGLYQSGLLIEAVNIGQKGNIRTELIINNKESLEKITKEIKQIEEKLVNYELHLIELKKSISKIKRIYSDFDKLPIGQKETIDKYIDHYIETVSKIDDQKEKYEMLKELEYKLKEQKGKIIVKGIIYPGTIVTINGITKTINKLMESIIITKEKDKIVYSAI